MLDNFPVLLSEPLAILPRQFVDKLEDARHGAADGEGEAEDGLGVVAGLQQDMQDTLAAVVKPVYPNTFYLNGRKGFDQHTLVW